MKKIIIPITIFLFIFVSCSNINKKETQDFSINIPKGFIQTNEIIDSAELQYYNTVSNLYIAVEKLNKDIYPNIDSLCEDYIYSLFDNVISIDSSSSIKKSIEYKDIEIEEASQNNSFNWIIKVVSNEKYYFIVWTWSNSFNYKENKKNMNQITNSFKLKTK